jgi:leader peptidase (prepilin peptidase)/N-methyltransferase
MIAMGFDPLQIAAFVFGACIGSFLNVCIYRIPASKSIVRPGSMCPHCGYAIPFYDNIPILSYLFLRGQCRQCHTKISPRYALVELLGGLFALACLLRFGPTLPALIYFAFIAVLLVVTFIDIDHRIIPNRISLPGIPIFFALSLLLPAVTPLDAALGILAGGGILWIVAQTYFWLKKIDGMGLGDVKLLAMIGPVVGWQGVLFTIFVASAVGTLVGVVQMIRSGQLSLKLAIPFGPFLSIGAMVYLFFGAEITRWYFKL